MPNRLRSGRFSETFLPLGPSVLRIQRIKNPFAEATGASSRPCEEALTRFARRDSDLGQNMGPVGFHRPG